MSPACKALTLSSPPEAELAFSEEGASELEVELDVCELDRLTGRPSPARPLPIYMTQIPHVS